MSDTLRKQLNPMRLSQYVSGLVAEIYSAGVTLELRKDFGYLVRVCESLSDKPIPTAMLNPLHNHIDGTNGFWIKGTNKMGEIVHVQAIRFDDLTGINLATMFEDLTAFYSDPYVSAPADEWCKSFAPAAKRITGRTCYHGEMWLRPDIRGRQESPLYTKLAMALALLHFCPDNYWGITYEKVVMSGVATKFGFQHIQDGGVLWHRPYREQYLNAYLVWLTGQDLLDMIPDDDFPLSETARLIAANKP